MLFDFRNSVFIVHKDNHWIKVLKFGGLDICISDDDDFVARLEMSGWGSVEANTAAAPLSRHYIGLPQHSIGDIGDIHHLKGPYAAFFK